MSPAPPGRWREELYPFGFAGILFTNTLFTQWVLYYHAPPPGVITPGAGTLSGSTVGALLLAMFLVQGLLNPWIGQWADRTRTPWGRRRPFVLLGVVPLAVVHAALFLGRLPGAIGIPLWGLLFLGVVQPYLSLLPSITADERRRVRLSLVGGVLALTASGAALVVGPGLVERAGFEGIAAAGALALLVSPLVPALLVREAPPAGPPPPLVGPRDLFALARESGMLRFLLGHALLAGALTALTMSVPYVVETLLGRPREATAWLNGSLFAGMVLAFPLVGVLAPRFGAVPVVRLAALAGAAVLLAMWGASASRETLATFAPWCLAFGLFGPTALCAIALPPVVVSRFADRDGRGREGLFFGLNGLAINLGNAAAAFGVSRLLASGQVRAVVLGTACAVALAGALIAGPRPPGARP